MFDIGWSELLVVGVIAVVVLDKKDLPEVMRGLRALWRWGIDLKEQCQAALAQLEREVTGEATGEDGEAKPRGRHFIRGDDGTLYQAYDVSEMGDPEQKDQP
jgi:Sec-independent protein translocase protein TatA